MKNFFKKNKKNIPYNGFTLIELIIVIAIMATISAITLFNSAKLNSSILLANTAYEISLIIRDAQVSGLGSKVFNNGGVATTSNQGVYIDSKNPNQIIFFADKNKDNKYSSPDEINQVYNIEDKRAGKILSICGAPTGPCNSSDITNLNIIFKRPNPEAYLWQGSEPTAISGSAVINVGFEGGECRSIIIYRTGAIQIDKSLCPTTL